MLLAAAPDRQASVVLRLSVWPREGEALTAQGLTVTLNGKPAKVNRLGTPTEPLLLSVVLDLIGDLTLAEAARQALLAEIENTKSQVALLRAQDGLRVLADPGTPRPRLAEIVRELPISGRAGLLETVVPAATLADRVLRSARVRSAVLFLTDGLITNYRQDYTNPVVNSSDANDMSRRFPEGLVKEKIRQLRDELARTLAPIFVVHLNYQSDRLNEAYQTGLLDLATSTGGEATFCRTPSDIAPAIQMAFARTAALQMLEVEGRLGKARQFEIAVDAPGREVQYRTRYEPPAPVRPPESKPPKMQEKMQEKK